MLLQAEVAASYIQMRAYEERLQLARKNVELQKETLRIVTLREQHGLVSDLDVQQATANLGATESLIPTLLTGQRTAQNRLCILLGQPPHLLAEPSSPPVRFPFRRKRSIVGIPGELLCPAAGRAAGRTGGRGRIGARSESPKRNSIPTSPSPARSAFRRSISTSCSSRAASAAGPGNAIGPGISWNILNYGRIRNNVHAQDARSSRQCLNYCRPVLRADEEVENGIVAFLQEQDRVKSLDKSTAPRLAPSRSRRYSMRRA